MAKTITFSLGSKSIAAAIKELEAYKQSIKSKTTTLRNRIAEEIAKAASTGFAGAIVDDLLKGGSRKADVSVTTEERGDVTVVIANGSDAVFVEFGAGVFHNGASGGSPHPKGAELGLTIGSFGTNGMKNVWGFYDEDGLHLTHGTPATMPMYNAMLEVCERISEIAKEVFAT